MTRIFSPRLDTLPLEQRRLWSELGQMPAEFVLYGGTALALQLGHRESIDFDFFAFRDIDTGALYRDLPILNGSRVIHREPNTLTCLVERYGKSIKVSLFGLSHMQPLRLPMVAYDNHLRVASLEDIAAAKMLAVQNRAEAKDYIDIDALLRSGLTLPQSLAAARTIYGSEFSPTPTLKALTYFHGGDLPTLDAEIRSRLVNAALAVDPLQLPTMKLSKSKSRRRGRAR